MEYDKGVASLIPKQ